MAEDGKGMSPFWLGVLQAALFGVSWILGTAIGWGLRQNVTLTFVVIGVVPLIVAGAVAWIGDQTGL